MNRTTEKWRRTKLNRKLCCTLFAQKPKIGKVHERTHKHANTRTKKHRIKYNTHKKKNIQIYQTTKKKKERKIKTRIKNGSSTEFNSLYQKFKSTTQMCIYMYFLPRKKTRKKIQRSHKCDEVHCERRHHCRHRATHILDG